MTSRIVTYWPFRQGCVLSHLAYRVRFKRMLEPSLPLKRGELRINNSSHGCHSPTLLIVVAAQPPLIAFASKRDATRIRRLLLSRGEIDVLHLGDNVGSNDIASEARATPLRAHHGRHCALNKQRGVGLHSGEAGFVRVWSRRRGRIFCGRGRLSWLAGSFC